MRKAILAAGLLALAVPASAETPIFHPGIDGEIARSLPKAGEIEALDPVVDDIVGVLFNVDVGPLLDATDPWQRRIDHGAPGRTLGELASRDDPWFEDRMRSSIYGTASEFGRMMEAISVAAPRLRQSLREFERGIEGALEDHDRRSRYEGSAWDGEGY